VSRLLLSVAVFDKNPEEGEVVGLHSGELAVVRGGSERSLQSTEMRGDGRADFRRRLRGS